MKKTIKTVILTFGIFSSLSAKAANCNLDEMLHITTKVFQIVERQLGTPKSQIKLDSQFTADLGAYDNDHLEIIYDVKESLGVDLSKENNILSTRLLLNTILDKKCQK